LFCTNSDVVTNLLRPEISIIRLFGFSCLQYLSDEPTHRTVYRHCLRRVKSDGGCAFNYLPVPLASLPGAAGMQFPLLKCVGAKGTMHIHTINTKNPKYSTKSATRLFCEYGANLGPSLYVPNASRFSSLLNAQLG